MQCERPNLIIRHRKENLKKCSLRGLEKREDLQFIAYPFSSLPPLNDYVVLVMEGAPMLSSSDRDKALLLLDSTWHYLPKMVHAIEKFGPLELRCLPGNFTTAYPRTQNGCVDPNRGLSSIEALYIAYKLTGRDSAGLLDYYHWKDQFLELNSFDC